MSQHSAIKYQLGTALVAGKQTVVLAHQEQFFNLHTLLEHARVKNTLSTEIRELSDSLLELIEDWSYWNETLAQVVKTLFAHRSEQAFADALLQQEELHWLPPLMFPRKLICIGTNYRDHLAEMGVARLPEYPYSFLKPPTTTLIGSGTPLQLPKRAKLVDWEAELVVVIGQRVRDIQKEDALQYVAGYSLLNDVSARDWIADAPPVGIDWVMQKAFDGFAPMGPLLTPALFVPDPQQLHITLTVNGQIKQDSTTANMVFSVREIIEHLTSIMTLEPGDVIATGTPAGVGHGKKPPEYLRAGDTMIVAIEGLGQLETPVIAKEN
jgi:2-keto-4-pentenoate hydratase/2-oxohepta-3-ene-1,7-dioic acid hydratase in catechol pathway